MGGRGQGEGSKREFIEISCKMGYYWYNNVFMILLNECNKLNQGKINKKGLEI